MQINIISHQLRNERIRGGQDKGHKSTRTPHKQEGEPWQGRNFLRLFPDVISSGLYQEKETASLGEQVQWKSFSLKKNTEKHKIRDESQTSDGPETIHPLGPRAHFKMQRESSKAECDIPDEKFPGCAAKSGDGELESSNFCYELLFFLCISNKTKETQGCKILISNIQPNAKKNHKLH